MAFTHDELVARDKANLDITSLRDESFEDMDNLPAPEIIAREIVEDLTAALRSSRPSRPPSKPRPHQARSPTSPPDLRRDQRRAPG